MEQIEIAGAPEPTAFVEAVPAVGTKRKERLKPVFLRRWQKALLWPVCGLLLLWGCLQLWMLTAEQNLRWQPDYPMQSLDSLLEKPVLDDRDYRTLLLQAGLGRPAVDALRGRGDMDTVKRLQKQFFASPTILCDRNTPVSAEERIVDDTGRKTAGTRLVGLEAGDILITPSCHTFGWRNGHAALVVDPEKGVTLESVVLGQDSCLQSIDKWACYPSVLVLRLRGADKGLREQIARQAAENYNGVPYGLTVGLFSDKYQKDGLESTHCAHLVWSAFRLYGFDLDSTGGPLVTPKNLANSPLLEVCQVYGLNPDRLWE